MSDSKGIRAYGPTGELVGGASITRVRPAAFGGCAWCGRTKDDGVEIVENPKTGARLCSKCLARARYLCGGGT